MEYIVFTEIHNWEEHTMERWYYGTYDRATANEVAYELGQDRAEGVFHSICPLAEAEKWGVKNLPY